MNFSKTDARCICGRELNSFGEFKVTLLLFGVVLFWAGFLACYLIYVYQYF